MLEDPNLTGIYSVHRRKGPGEGCPGPGHKFSARHLACGIREAHVTGVPAMPLHIAFVLVCGHWWGPWLSSPPLPPACWPVPWGCAVAVHKPEYFRLLHLEVTRDSIGSIACLLRLMFTASLPSLGMDEQGDTGV